MPVIVSDTSPLNLLIQIQQAEILPQLFQRVYIPPQVVMELSHPKAPAIVQQFIGCKHDWLETKSPQSVLVFDSLDDGESAAISLALEMKLPLMIDERIGRNIALAEGLEVIGVIGILERAGNLGFIEDLARVHKDIRSLRFHISEKILNESLARHLELRNSN